MVPDVLWERDLVLCEDQDVGRLHARGVSGFLWSCWSYYIRGMWWLGFVDIMFIVEWTLEFKILSVCKSLKSVSQFWHCEAMKWREYGWSDWAGMSKSEHDTDFELHWLRMQGKRMAGGLIEYLKQLLLELAPRWGVIGGTSSRAVYSFFCRFVLLMLGFKPEPRKRKGGSWQEPTWCRRDSDNEYVQVMYVHGLSYMILDWV
jgi:hypothetical protein